MAGDISELDDKARLMGVSWMKLHNYANNLAKTYVEVKREIDTGRFGTWGQAPGGGRDLPWTMDRWLSYKVGLSEEHLLKILALHSRLMASEDRDKILREQQAQKVAREKEKAANLAAIAEARAEVERQQARIKADQERQAEEKAAARKRAEEAKRKEQQRATKNEGNRRYRKNRKAREQFHTADPYAQASAMIDLAYQAVTKADADWVISSMLATSSMVRGRDLFASNQAFGDWLKKNKQHEYWGHQDRAALINLGRLDQAELRRILESTDRRSYRYIWDDVRLTYVGKTDSEGTVVDFPDRSIA